MTTFTVIPDGATDTTTPRVRSAAFGDGYRQDVGDGINTMPRSWALKFTGTAAEITAIDTFLRARAGAESFVWVPPIGASGDWKCKSWSSQFQDYNTYVLTATFEEVFGD